MQASSRDVFDASLAIVLAVILGQPEPPFAR
jgi:hypothetical protein